MDLGQALVLGIVEGLTEFLPISSTGHLMLTSKLLRIPESEFHKSFEIAIQLGAILAVVLLYGRSLLTDWATIQRVAVAFVPTAVLGFLLYKTVKQYLLADTTLVLWSFAVGGVVLILFEWLHGERPGAVGGIDRISYPQAFVIGVCQTAALVPGVSRAAATVVGGLALGLRRRTIVEFSFLLAVPTMAAATGYDLLQSGADFDSSQWLLLGAGFAVSCAVAILAIRFLLRFVQTHTFIAFGVYRILAAAAFWGLLMLCQ